MNLYVLDNDILTLFQDGDVVVSANVSPHSPQESAITVLSVEEQLSGWYSYIRQAKQIDKMAWADKRLAQTTGSLSAFQILTFDVPSINRYDSLRVLKLNVRKMDLRIAAVVLVVGATLVTRNALDFNQVPGLTFVDWSK